MIEEVDDDAVLDVGLITAAQKIEHYKIAGYGSVVALAKALGHEDAAERLAETLQEEKAADEKLNEIAEGSVNQKALGQSDAGEIDGEATVDEGDDAEESEMAEASVSGGRGSASRRGAPGLARAPNRAAPELVTTSPQAGRAGSGRLCDSRAPASEKQCFSRCSEKSARNLN